ENAQTPRSHPEGGIKPGSLAPCLFFCFVIVSGSATINTRPHFVHHHRYNEKRVASSPTTTCVPTTPPPPNLAPNINAFASFSADIDPCVTHDTAGSSTCLFRFMRSEKHHFTDDRERSLILSENLQLLAVSLQRPADAVQLDVRYYKSTGTNPELLPVVLGLNSQNLFITCTGPQERPTLKIEKWDENLRNISSTTDLLRFVFFQRAGSAGLYFELESAMYRGWYISTSQRNGQPIEMDVKGSSKRVTIFTAD
ncbi:interleukin-1 beta-like, partial [Rhincodon typus]|uniref:interleukin-1 beta-like n=1 Tax=Rhincodon typus TaxID=259920 RepID=UPI00202F3F91